MITIRYFAGARAAAGVAEESAPAGTTIAGMITAADDRLAVVLKASSFLVDGTVWHDREAPLPFGCTVDILPPFAGG